MACCPRSPLRPDLISADVEAQGGASGPDDDVSAKSARSDWQAILGFMAKDQNKKRTAKTNKPKLTAKEKKLKKLAKKDK